MTDHVQWIILGGFTLLFLVLAQSRELMRQVGRTAEEWHRMRAAFKHPGDDERRGQATDVPSASDGNQLEPRASESRPVRPVGGA